MVGRANRTLQNYCFLAGGTTTGALILTVLLACFGSPLQVVAVVLLSLAALALQAANLNQLIRGYSQVVLVASERGDTED